MNNLLEITKDLVMEESKKAVEFIFKEIDSLQLNKEFKKIGKNIFNTHQGIYKQISSFNEKKPTPVLIFYMKEMENGNLLLEKRCISIRG